MRTIKQYKKGDYVLEHKVYLDDWGFERNSMDLFNSKTNTHYPCFGEIRMSEMFTENTEPYTEEEYERMISKEIKSIEEWENKNSA